MAVDERKAPPAEVAQVLSGKRIVITRARSQASELARRIEDLGGHAVAFPTIEIQPPESYAALDEAIRKIRTYDWIVFTSVNGVDQFLTRLQKLDQSVREFQHMRVAAIGPETARRLESAGIEVQLMPKQYQAEGILEELKPEMVRGKRILLPRAAKARDVLPETLRQWGAVVDVIEAYRTALPRSDASALRKLLSEKKIDMVTFTSSSTVSNFASLFPGEHLARVLAGAAVACIGPITKKTLEDLGGRADVVSDQFTIPVLVDAIVKYFARHGDTGASAAPSSAR
jgi:uroporphyrinogen III methyltransferase / synthase